MKRTVAVFVAIAAATAALAAFTIVRADLPGAGTTAAAPAPVTAAPSPGNTGALAVSDQAADGSIAEDRDYRRVPKPSPVDDPKVINIEEFFWYGCPHCYRMESLLAQWLPTLPGDVHFMRVPENLGREEGVIHQRAFYVALILGIESQIHLPLMQALVEQHQPLITPQALANFIAGTAHIQPAAFNAEFSSFVVDGEIRHASELSMNYCITGVPSLIVGGEYIVETGLPGIVQSSGGEAGQLARMLKVARALVDKVRDELKPATH